MIENHPVVKDRRKSRSGSRERDRYWRTYLKIVMFYYPGLGTKCLRENKIATDRFHVLHDPAVDPSPQVVTKGHPPVSAIAENRVQLPEAPLVEEPTLKGSHRLNIAFSVNSIGFLNGIV
jgi:hypothetical protein